VLLEAHGERLERRLALRVGREGHGVDRELAGELVRAAELERDVEPGVTRRREGRALGVEEAAGPQRGVEHGRVEVEIREGARHRIELAQREVGERWLAVDERPDLEAENLRGLGRVVQLVVLPLTDRVTRVAVEHEPRRGGARALREDERGEQAEARPLQRSTPARDGYSQPITS